MQQPMPNPKDISDPTAAMNITLVLMAKAFKLNYSTPTNNNQRISLNPYNKQIAQPGMNIGQDRQMQMVGDPRQEGNVVAPWAEEEADESLLRAQGIGIVVESNDLSNPVTSNSVPTTKESKVVENDKVIAPGMFRIDPRKTFKEDNFVSVNNVRASIRTNPIIVSQPHVITKKDVNSDSNGLPSTGVDNTA
ncbi:hypothetical protein Tco_0227223 [Tanacetum coccineum]